MTDKVHLRGRRGTDHPRAKLTRGDVIAIKASLALGERRECELARHFDVNKTTIRAIQQGRTWKHVA